MSVHRRWNFRYDNPSTRTTFLAIALLLLPLSVHAKGDANASFGGGISGSTDGFSQTFEFTALVFAQSSSGFTLPTVASVGARFGKGEPRYLYGEIAFYLGATVGGGFGALHDREAMGPGAHLFAGLPVPVGKFGGMTPYLEPYYRPQFRLDGGFAVHEFGLLLKFLTGTLDFSN